MFSKRILNDIKYFEKTKPENIYIFPVEQEDTIYAMIIGSEDTPYENGFYFFTITFPTIDGDRYPFIPPKIIFSTTDHRTRFNPNLYVEGKVCLSILGTWQGPAWSPAGTFLTALLSIQAEVMNNEPLRNEPGYDRESKNNVERYSQFVEHQNYQHALVYQYKFTPKNFECFKPIMTEYIIKYKNVIIDKLQTNIQKYNNITTFSSSFSQSNTHNNYNKILQDFNELIH